LVNIFIKKCIRRETFVGFFRESCQKLSGYEKDHESFEEIFWEQLLRGVFACVYGMDLKLPNGSTT
jgi:hypothetical protein